MKSHINNPVWTDQEKEAILTLMESQDLTGTGVLRQALRLYQLHTSRLADGETVTWSGDAQRQRDFAGDLHHEPMPSIGQGTADNARIAELEAELKRSQSLAADHFRNAKRLAACVHTAKAARTAEIVDWLWDGDAADCDDLSDALHEAATNHANGAPRFGYDYFKVFAAAIERKFYAK